MIGKHYILYIIYNWYKKYLTQIKHIPKHISAWKWNFFKTQWASAPKNGVRIKKKVYSWSNKQTYVDGGKSRLKCFLYFLQTLGDLADMRRRTPTICSRGKGERENIEPGDSDPDDDTVFPLAP